MTRTARYTAAAILAAFLAVHNLSGCSPRARQAETTWRANCQENLKQLGIVLRMYAEEHGGVYPKLREEPGQLMFRCEDVHPEYLADPFILICPAAGEDIGEPPPASENPQWYFEPRVYWYLGYAMANEEQGRAFLDAYRAQATTGDKVITDEDLADADGTPIRRLYERVERDVAKDLNIPVNSPRHASLPSTIPTMIERLGHHKGGANVLYLDGHVEFIAYPGKWPMTKDFIQGLESLDELREQ